MVRAKNRELFERSVLAVILCESGTSHYKTAFDLFYHYGVLSILCKREKNLLDIFNYKCGFLQSDLRLNPRLTCEKLLDLAEDQGEFIILLISEGRCGDAFLKAFSDELECRYIPVFSEESIHSIPFFTQSLCALEEKG